jgi:hypothetical protein
MESSSSKTGDTGSTTKSGDTPTFEPRKGKVLKHIKVGVWDLYVERDQFLSYLPTSWKIDAYTEIWNDLPYLWKAIRDLASVAWPMLSLYLVLAFAGSLLPALTLWCVRGFSVRRQQRWISHSAIFQVFWTAPLNREYRPRTTHRSKKAILDCFFL